MNHEWSHFRNSETAELFRWPGDPATMFSSKPKVSRYLSHLLTEMPPRADTFQVVSLRGRLWSSEVGPCIYIYIHTYHITYISHMCMICNVYHMYIHMIHMEPPIYVWYLQNANSPRIQGLKSPKTPRLRSLCYHQRQGGQESIMGLSENLLGFATYRHVTYYHHDTPGATSQHRDPATAWRKGLQRWLGWCVDFLYKTYHFWLVVTGTWLDYFPIQLGMSSSQLTFTFFRGVSQPPTRWVCL